jgi:iron complex transport system substrate-binding protein
MRIISLCPSLTELVFDLGLADSIVGITKYCIHPSEGVAAIEKVGGTKDPDVARIIELRPDVVLVNQEENRIEDAEALMAAGITLVNTFPKTPLETVPMVRAIGAALAEVEVNSEEASRIVESAGAIALSIEQCCAQVAERAKNRPPVSFAYLIWRKPWMTVNGDTYPSAILEQAGGTNAFAKDEQRFPCFEIEALVAADPDRILLCTEPFPFQEKHIGELSEATGIPAERFCIADGEYLSWYGSRTPAGIKYAAELLK